MIEINAAPRLDLKIEGNIATISFNNPRAHNAMTWEMYEQLKKICDKLAINMKIRAVILRGEGGRAFISGSDIKQFVNLRKDEPYEKTVDLIFQSLQQLPIPTIALINGLAMGSGLLIATACDFRISTPDTRFGIPIAKTLGNCLSPSNLSWISSHLGMDMVKRMLLLAEPISATELLDKGYLYKVVKAEEIDQCTNDLAICLSQLAPMTQKATKLTLAKLLENNLPDCSLLMRETYNSQDFQEGVIAFISSKKPNWTGK